jgi:uncharacterized protein
MTKPTYAAPVLSAESQPFWDAAKDGRLLIKHCDGCGRNHWYPRALCPFCWSDRTRWLESSGEGEVYSFTVMRRAKVPYALAYVKLDDGPTMMTNVVADVLDSIAVGQRVRVTFGEAEGGAKVPVFAPLGATA